MQKQTGELITLKFTGRQFEDHGLEIDVLAELIEFKKLLVETSKELWRHANPDRERLPKGFEDSIKIKFYGLGDGSTTVSLKRVKEPADGDLPLHLEDELNTAISLWENSIEAADKDEQMPEDLPKTIIDYFKEFGKSLQENETIMFKSPGRDKYVNYTTKTRDRFIDMVEKRYEDITAITGEVRAADLDGCNFKILCEDGRRIHGKFKPEQEQIIIEALKDHENVKILINGQGEFSPESGDLIKFTNIETVKLQHTEQISFNINEKPIWEVITEIGDKVPREAWDSIPTDLSKNLDQYLYGTMGDD